MKRSKGFTLIELLAVIVILAIIALIATPMVLKYIENAKEGSNDISAESIIRAADNYYAASLLDNNTTYPKEFDLANKDDMAILGLKGDAPDEGILEIYSDGTTFIEAMYDNVIYVKLPNETKVSKNPKVIGDVAIWGIDNNGILNNYNKSSIASQASTLFYMYDKYMAYSNRYALGMEDSKFPLDFSKSLVENINALEEAGTLDSSNLPLAVNKEIETIIKLADVEEKYTPEELQTILVENQEQIPLTMDYATVTSMGNDYSNKNNTEIYKLIVENLNTYKTLIVPNYVRLEDGSLKKVIGIGDNLFRSKLNPTDANEKGYDVIISYGIKSVGTNAFYESLINSVVLPNTIEKIETTAFYSNRINSLILPSGLISIGDAAFAKNNLSGKLIIPKNVEYISQRSFNGEDNTCSSSVTLVCDAMVGIKNNLTEVVFEEESKIKNISYRAFMGNQLTTITIPESIEIIADKAFDCPTLTSATIQRAKGNDLVVATDAFGTITPTYQP